MPQFNTHTRASFSDHIIAAYLPKKFLSRLVAELHLQKFGKKASVPAHGGRTIKWNRFSNLSSSTTAITDGVSPDGIEATSTAVTANASQYGQFVTVSDELQLVAVNDTMEDMVDALSYTAALSIDQLIRNELDANLTQAYADAASNSSKANVESGTDNLTSTDLKVNLKTLRAADVPTFEDGLYRGVIHPYMEYGLLTESSAGTLFIERAQNGSGDSILEKGEIGNAFGIKLMRSSNVRADSTSTNTYGNILVGKDAYGVVDINGMDTKMIVKPHGSSGTEDPLDQRATLGYKFWFVPKVLEAARGIALWAYGA